MRRKKQTTTASPTAEEREAIRLAVSDRARLIREAHRDAIELLEEKLQSFGKNVTLDCIEDEEQVGLGYLVDHSGDEPRYVEIFSVTVLDCGHTLDVYANGGDDAKIRLRYTSQVLAWTDLVQELMDTDLTLRVTPIEG